MKALHYSVSEEPELKGKSTQNPEFGEPIRQNHSGALRYLNDTVGSNENEDFHLSQIEDALKSFLTTKIGARKNCHFRLPTELVAEELLDKEAKFGKLGRLYNGLYVLNENGIHKQQSEVPYKRRKISNRTLTRGVKKEILKKLQVIYMSAEDANAVYLEQNDFHRDETFEASGKCRGPKEA
ncbi:unnamed protein product [Rodentolepis nana]|uniref:BEN domain-containing protein n=1 Tax=Rodentolepis nana TaxID=102285 RepID=A0A0R3T2S5_RODNA|nr:unnamed protein product [Rodentolepis nana]